MAAQPSTSVTTQSLMDILVSQGALNAAVAERIKMAEVQSGKSQEDLILEQHLVSEKALAQAKATFYNVSYLDLDSIPVSPDALAFVTADIAERFHVFPVSLDRNAGELTLAMSDPLDLSAIEFVEQKTGFRGKPVASEASKVEESITTRYESSLSQQVTEAMESVEPDKTKILNERAEEGGFIRGEKMGEIVTKILNFAFRARPPDVKIE